jgi:hypothetical protein
MNPKNAYYVLELGPTATVSDIERQGQKLVALLSVGARQAGVYSCPFGELPRDETMVREAVARLRDPSLRQQDAAVVRLLLDGSSDAPVDADAPLPDAFALAGYPGL